MVESECPFDPLYGLCRFLVEPQSKLQVQSLGEVTLELLSATWGMAPDSNAIKPIKDLEGKWW